MATEREFQADINDAIARTESEIFDEAMGNEELDRDGDDSLEQMGEGLEGDELDEEQTASETDPDAQGEEEEEPEDGASEVDTEVDPEADEEGKGEDQPLAAQGEEPQQRRGMVPSDRVREATARAQKAETELTALREQFAAVNAKIDTLTQLQTRPAAEPKPVEQPAPKPDMFAEPEKYEQWVLDQAQKKAEERFEARMTDWQRGQQAQQSQRLDDIFREEATSDRGWQFNAAYNTLTSKLDPKNPQHRAVVNRITSSPDPVSALYTWWEDNGAPEYRESIYQQLTGEEAPAPQRRAAPQRQAPARQAQAQPRHVIRGPVSLNGARGAQRQQIADPEMLDGSEESIFRFATR